MALCLSRAGLFLSFLTRTASNRLTGEAVVCFVSESRAPAAVSQSSGLGPQYLW